MSTYRIACEEIVRKAADNPSLGYDEATLQLVLTNLYHLLPDLTWPQMERVAHGAALNQRQAIVDLQYGAYLLDKIILDDPERATELDKPAVFVAPHFGSYRLIGPYLMARGRPMTIVIDDLVADAQAVGFVELFTLFADQRNLDKDLLRFRYTSERTLLRGMARDLREGRSLLLYFDGNKSTGKSQDHLTEISFFELILRSRIGIPQVAIMAKVPIIPVTMSRGMELGVNTISFATPIAPDIADPRTFPAKVMQKLWTMLQYRVVAAADQWEAIRYIHKFVDYTQRHFNEAAEPARVLAFDHRRFALKVGDGRGELYDRRRMSLTPVRGAVLSALDRVQNAPAGTDIVTLVADRELVQWMHQRQYVVSALSD